MSDTKTLGEARVRTDFNVTGSDVVTNIQNATAHLIDEVEKMRGDGAALISGEKARLISLAQTAYEEAAMWAVKAATA
jgi:hypothetical protein